MQDFEVWVHLGCTSDEQRFTQPVHFSLDIKFHKNLEAVYTDELKDAIDYVSLADLIKQVAEKKHYHLVEHLCHEVTIRLSSFLTEKLVQGELAVHVHKIRVPVENIRNGVIFTCITTV